MKTIALTALMGWCFTALAQAAASPTPITSASEPAIKHIVIEDDGNRIEELQVRGHTQSIKITSKVGIKNDYEIITGDGSRDLSAGPGSTRGAVGQRVWRMMSF